LLSKDFKLDNLASFGADFINIGLVGNQIKDLNLGVVYSKFQLAPQQAKL